MKKYKTLLLIFFLSVSFITAQSRFTFLEVDVGADWASIHPCKIFHSYVANPYARILYKREWKERIYLMSGIAYQPKGTDKSFLYERPNGLATFGSAILKLDYLTVPLLVELEFDFRNTNWKVYFNGGVFYSFLMKDEWTIQMEETTKEKANIDLKTDAGILFGTGISCLLGNRFEIIARLNVEYGLKYWSVLHPRADILNVKSRNWPLTIGVAYLVSD